MHQPAAFDVTVGNHGLRTAEGVEVSIPVPSGAEPLSAPSECRVTDSTIVCAVGRMPAADEVSLPIVVASAAAGRLELVATVTGTVPDDDDANNIASAHVVVSGPPPPPNDIAETQLIPKPPPRTDIEGAPVTFSWLARNSGPARATGVEVIITPPPDATFISASPGCELHGEIVICRVGDLPDGGADTVSVTFKPGATGRDEAFATMRSDRIDTHPRKEESNEGTSVRRKPTRPPSPPPVTG